MKLNIDVNPISGKVSISMVDVDLINYKNISKSSIDEAVSRAIELAYIASGESEENARIIARVTRYGTLLHQPTCQGETTASEGVVNADDCDV